MWVGSDWSGGGTTGGGDAAVAVGRRGQQGGLAAAHTFALGDECGLHREEERREEGKVSPWC